MAQRNNEIMAQFNDEEFLSSSKMAEQLSVDEARWQQQDCTFSIPVMGAEKQKLDFSAFSGIIGQMDLSVEYVPFVFYLIFVVIDTLNAEPLLFHFPFVPYNTIQATAEAYAQCVI